MKPAEFVKRFWADALQSERATGISAVATLAQAAWESGWGRAAPGNMFFGVKDTDGVNGNEQLITTTEYHNTPGVKYPRVLSVTPVVRNGRKMFRYKVQDYFRKYATPADSFTDHGRFYLRNPRYRKALEVRHDPVRFVQAVAAAGYATDPNYATNLIKIIEMIRRLLPAGK